MGHQREATLPRTRAWKQVIELIEVGGNAAQIAAGTIRAAEDVFDRVGTDQGVIVVVSMLAHLPIAARSDDFARALRLIGLAVGDAPKLIEITTAFSEGVDAGLFSEKIRRTDLGEIAQLSAVEAITETITSSTISLFGCTAHDVRQGFAGLNTVVRFGEFMRRFFSRLMLRLMNSFLSRVMSDHVGTDRRFTTVHQEREFAAAIETHSEQSARIIEQFAGQWFSKAKFNNDGGIPRSSVAGFTRKAMEKLTKELKRGAQSHGK